MADTELRRFRVIARTQVNIAGRLYRGGDEFDVQFGTSSESAEILLADAVAMWLRHGWVEEIAPKPKPKQPRKKQRAPRKDAGITLH